MAMAEPADNFLVLCGIGHMAYGFGVPERILSSGLQTVEAFTKKTFLIYTHEESIED